MQHKISNIAGAIGIALFLLGAAIIDFRIWQTVIRDHSIGCIGFLIFVHGIALCMISRFMSEANKED